MAGAACAVALRAGGASVRVIERGRAPGGRMAAPELHGRRVDIGAGYFTARDHGFVEVVESWQRRGLARPWTDTFAVLRPGAEPDQASGPLRWAAPGGLRSLVRDLLVGIDVQLQTEVADLPDGPVVLAMPDPQARRVDASSQDWLDCDPVIAVVLGFAGRTWDFAAAFVNDQPDVTFLADDGSRRGDGAAVLVAHSTSELARRHLDDPDGAVAPVVTAVDGLIGCGTPDWTHAHRWRFAKPAASHDAWFDLTGRLGRCGDQWCPDGAPRVESAWRSGTELAAAALAAGWR